VLTLPVPALRTDRDLASTAQIIGMTEDELSEKLRAPVAGSQDDAAAAQPARSMTLGDRTVELPEGVTAEQVRAAMAKRRAGEELSAEERGMMRKVFQGSGGGGGAGRPPGNYQFGSSFWVIVERDGQRIPVRVRTGITDLDRAEVVEGLQEGDTVLMLPSAHLVETQQQLQSFITRRIGGVPGIGQR
jgi:hypothetical protein